MKELTITDEAVKRAAEKCSDAKGVLKELFPEVFETKPKIEFFVASKAKETEVWDVYIDTSKLGHIIWNYVYELGILYHTVKKEDSLGVETIVYHWNKRGPLNNNIIGKSNIGSKDSSINISKQIHKAFNIFIRNMEDK